MKRVDLTNIIQKYNIGAKTGGAAVKWDIVDDTITILNKGTEISVLAKVEYQLDKADSIQDISFGVFETDRLLKLLSALDDDFKFQIRQQKDKPVALDLEDSSINVDFMLADLSIIDVVNGLKNKPAACASIELAKETIDRFIKAQNALSDAPIFSIQTEGEQVNFTLNYATHNTNRICFSCGGTVTNQIFDPVLFDAELVKNIFLVNKNAETAQFDVAQEGLASLYFVGPNWKSEYHFTKKIIN